MVAGERGIVGLAMVGSGFAARFHEENYRRVYGVGVRFVGVYSHHPGSQPPTGEDQRVRRPSASSWYSSRLPDPS